MILSASSNQYHLEPFCSPLDCCSAIQAQIKPVYCTAELFRG